MRKILYSLIAVGTFIVDLLGQGTAPQPKIVRFVPTSELVRVASMAARDEGYNPDAPGSFLDELRTSDCKAPIQGYESIALYRNAHPVRTYSIRVETGDVVDENACIVFRYPNLLKFRAETLKGFGTKAVSLDAIAGEVGCEKVSVLPRPGGRH